MALCGSGPLPSYHSRAGGIAGGDAHPVGDGCGRNDAVEPEHSERVDHRHDILLAPEHHFHHREGFRLRHQPDADLGDHAEIRLHEEPVERGAEGVFVERPGWIAAHGAEPGAHDFAVGKHDFHAALMSGVIAVGRVADTVLERVAEHAAPAWIGAVDPQRIFLVPDEFVEVEIGDAGLDQGVGQLGIDLDGPHAAEIEDHRPLEAGGSAAIGIVAAERDGPQRQAIVIGDAEHSLSLRPRLPGGRRRTGRMHRPSRANKDRNSQPADPRKSPRDRHRRRGAAPCMQNRNLGLKVRAVVATRISPYKEKDNSRGNAQTCTTVRNSGDWTED